MKNIQQFFIPFHLADPAGVVFFGHVFTLAHQVFEQFVIEQLKCQWVDWFQHPDWVIPIKKTEAEFHLPLKAGQICELQCSISAMTTSSFVFVTHFFQPHLCCTVQSVHVFCQQEPKQKMAIPSHLRTTLERYLVDH